MATPARPIFQPDGKNAIHDGVEHEPSGGQGLLDPTDSVLLLLDHAQLAQLYTMVAPNYQALIESYGKAQDVVTKT